MTLMWVPQWIALFPLVAAMLAVWVGTTYFWLRTVGISPAISLGAAPAVTSTVIWALSWICFKVGWFWSGARVIPILVLIGLTGMFLYLRGRRRKAAPVLSARPPWGLIAACVVGWLLGALPAMLAAPPNNPLQQWDPSFHMNGIWGITQYGIAAPGYGLTHNFGGAVESGYPIGWHAFTSLFATATTTVETANISNLAMTAVWVFSTAVFARTLFPDRIVTASAAVISGLLLSMPQDGLWAWSQAPNAMSVAYLPGIAALAVVAGRHAMKLVNRPPGRRLGAWASGRIKKTWVSLIVLLVALYGGIQTHPIIAFNLMVLLLPAAVAGGAALIVHSLRRKRIVPLILVRDIAVLATAVIVFVMLTPEVESMRNYNRGGVGLPTALSQVLAPVPPYAMSIGLTLFATAVSIMAALGILRIIFARNSPALWARWESLKHPIAWPIWSYVLFLVLIFFAYGPDWAVRKWFVGPWFSDGRRIMEPASLPLAVLCAVGFAWFSTWLVRAWTSSLRPATGRQQTIGACVGGLILFALTAGAALPSKVTAARSVLDPSALGKAGMASQGVLDMMRQLPDLLPEDAVVLGDPQAGAMYSQMIGQRVAYFPQLTLLNQDRESQEILVERFKDIGQDPLVCEAVREGGITHFFAAPDGAYYGRLRSDRMPGLYGVDTSEGFEVVAMGDNSTLYRITACD